MSYGRSFQFIAAECLKQRDDETGNVPDERLYFKGKGKGKRGFV